MNQKHLLSSVGPGLGAAGGCLVPREPRSAERYLGGLLLEADTPHAC